MATLQRTNIPPTSTALADALAQVTRRLRWQRVIRFASRGGLITVILALVAVGLAHWNALPDWLPLEIVIPVLLVLGVSIGIGAAYARPIDLMNAARLTESRLGLKERLSSALEFERTDVPRDPETALLRRLQQEDAAAHARSLQTAEAVPLSPLPWETRALVPALVLLFLALLLPTLPIFVPPALRTERAIVQKSGQNLSTGARRIEKTADAKSLPATKRAAQKMGALSRKMQAGRMDKKQAMVQTAELRKQIADEQKRLAQSGSDPSQTSKTLDQAGNQLAQSLGANSGKPGAPANSTPEVQGAAQAMQRNDASGLRDQLRRLALRTASDKMSPAQQKQAAQDLQKLSNALQGTSQSEAQKHVQAAADALKHGDQARAADELRRAAEAAQRENQRQQDAQGLQQAQQTLQNNEQQMAQAEKPSDVPHDSGSSSPSSQSEPSKQNGPQGQPSPVAHPGQTGQQGQPGQGKSPGQPAGKSPGGQPGQSGKSGNSPSGKTGQGQSGQSGQEQSGQPGPGKGAGQTPGHSGGQTPGQNGPSGSSAQGGAPGNTGDGSGKSAPNTPGPGQNTPSSGQGQTTPGQNTGIVRGAAHPLNPKFDPTKNPKYGKVFLGNGTNDSGSRVKTQPGAKSQPGTPTASVVPYTREIAPARKDAESAVDKEDVPPSYRSRVRRYFDSIQPPASHGK